MGMENIPIIMYNQYRLSYSVIYIGNLFYTNHFTAEPVSTYMMTI